MPKSSSRSRTSPKSSSRSKTIPDDNDDIKIIYAPRPVAVEKPGDYLPPKGGEPLPEEHALWGLFGSKKVGDLAAELKTVKDKIARMIEGLGRSVIEGVELDEITVGLCLSVEGHIGLASAGAETSIELTFKVK